MDINPYILSYLIATLICMAALLYATIRQFREVMRPKNSFTRLRWRLFFLPALMFFGLLVGLPRLIDNLHISLAGANSARRIIGNMIILAAVTWLILSIYTYKERKE